MQYKIEKSAYLFFTAIAWLYIWLRAFYVPFQSDEAATFFMYVQPAQFLPPSAAIDANNHLLNSFLTWISYQLFGSSPVSLRLPNILAAPVYFFFIFKLSKLLNNTVLRWGFILLSIGTNFILEFFSYSRGYGLSMAFLTASLYELILIIKKLSLKRIILLVLFTILATASNLNLIFISLGVYFLLAFTIISRYHSKERKNSDLGLLIILLAGGLSSAFFIHFSFQIKDIAGFYYGSSAGFYKVTVESLVTMLSGPFSIVSEFTVTFIFFIIIFLSIFLFIKEKKFRTLFAWQNVFLFLFLASLAGSVLLNKFWHVNFQEDRAAMHLIPVFYGMVFFSIDSLNLKFRRYLSILIIPLVFILVYSARQISLNKSVYGNSQQIPVEFFRYIKDGAAEKTFPPVVSSYQARRQVWAFMNYRSGGLLNPLKVSDFPDQHADFLIDALPLEEPLQNHFELLIPDRSTQLGLFKKIEIPAYSTFTTQSLENPINTQNEYLEMFRISADSLVDSNVKLEVELKIESAGKPLQAVIVAEVFDKERKSLVCEAIDLDQLQPEWNAEHHLFRHVMIMSIPTGSESILLYLWNKKKVTVQIIEGSLMIKVEETKGI